MGSRNNERKGRASVEQAHRDAYRVFVTLWCVGLLGFR